MSQTDFRSFVDALDTAGSTRPVSAPPIRRVAVLGAGAVGQLLACEALAAGLDVVLHSVFGRDLEDLEEQGSITVRGNHLVGSYAVGEAQPGQPAIKLASSVDQAVINAEVIFVATPASAHATYAGVLADVLVDGQVVVLVPGRFLGSVAFRQDLARHHCRADLTIGELAATPYLASRIGATVTVQGVTRSADLATLPVDAASGVVERLSVMLPHLTAVDSPLVTAFGTVTGVIAVAPMLTNVAVMDGRDSSVLLRDLVPAALSGTLIRALDQERRDVAFHYGVRDLPSAGDWLRAAFDPREQQDLDRADDDLAAVMADLEIFDEVTVGGTGGPHVTDDVPHTMVPLVRAGRNAGVPTPATEAVVALASCLIGDDLMSTGRSLEGLGMGGIRPPDVRRRLSTAAEVAPQAMTWWSV
ncbi:NAD/NADP octopine/nopaline dehydrogenase family protein [Nocardioides terrisoli]|uniref:NAD/NADP octopine/nopaline dehydrogenase family protein n=1 Tax=Nocardioides terrisoli TaxID=3388267 RepID=UPI00287B77A6|nr:NAD/NADP octopine/nopaline dehydrogenase family protein [Nocardioides marmorisolisilvae]